MTFQVVFDANDPDHLASFWAGALGYVKQSPPEGFDSWDAFLSDMDIPEAEWNNASAIVDPLNHGPRIYFQKVPEAKTTKNRVHLDVNASGGSEATLEARKSIVDHTAAQLVIAGATELGPVAQRDEYWIVLQDPEGNEFCVH